MNVRLQHVAELDAQLANERQVALKLLSHRVDQRRLQGELVDEQVRERVRFSVEELSNDHDFLRQSPRTTSTAIHSIDTSCTVKKVKRKLTVRAVCTKTT